MVWAFFVSGAADRGVEKADVERRIMTDQNRALAFVFPEGLADRPENHVERLALLDRRAERVRRIDAGDLERTRVDIRAGKRYDVRGDDRIRMQQALVVHAHDHRGD